GACATSAPVVLPRNDPSVRFEQGPSLRRRLAEQINPKPPDAEFQHPPDVLGRRLRDGVEDRVPTAGVRRDGERRPDPIPQFDLVMIAWPAAVAPVLAA